MQVFRRAKGETLTAAAAYRASQNISDERTGVVSNYRQRGVVDLVEMFAPPGAPCWACDRAALWNAVESKKRVNGRPARE
jgi:hypothetical protein